MTTEEARLTCQPDESATAFAIRQIQHAAWVAGHDSGCSVSLSPCYLHASPFRDEAVAR